MNGLVRLKDQAIFWGWVAGLVLLGVLVWSLSQPLRANYMLLAVNRVLAAGGDERQLESPLKKASAKTVPPGRWYSLKKSDSQLLVFTIMHNGVLLPCGAVVSPDGAVAEMIPLGAHARQVFGQIPKGMLQIYTRKIEAASAGASADTGGQTGRGGK